MFLSGDSMDRSSGSMDRSNGSMFRSGDSVDWNIGSVHWSNDSVDWSNGSVYRSSDYKSLGIGSMPRNLAAGESLPLRMPNHRADLNPNSLAKSLIGAEAPWRLLSFSPEVGPFWGRPAL
ncbi:MAG TPA: hypothetical protein VH988_05330 [Thermoanaerobaculia bacterium]|jgi:hypothetical protein|nr:hypothetical protein [Thermoanaerobaculia bacterium]